jgi:hypothetical protein
VVHLPVALAAHVRGDLGSDCLQADLAKQARLPNNHQHNPCPNINAELLLLSSIGYTMRILLCPLVLVVNIDDVSTEMCRICKEH